MAEDIVGLQGLFTRMEALPLTLGRTLLVRAARKGAVPIAEEMARRAPDDPETPGSRIRENIIAVVSEQTATGAILKVGPSSKAWFAGFSEWGTAHQARQPFAQPSFDAKVDEAIALIGSDLGEAIERELKE